MIQWLEYYVSRVLFTLPIILGVVVTSVILGSGNGILSFILLTYLAFTLRLRNDFEDWDKDKIAFPGRPLPRGIFKKKQVKDALFVLEIVLLIFFLALIPIYGLILAPLVFFTLGYLWAIREYPLKNPLYQTLFSQGVVIPVVLLVCLMNGAGFQIYYALLMFGAMATFEVCRKLNPLAHPINHAVVHIYGYKVTFWVIVLFLLITALGTYGFGAWNTLMSGEIGVFLSLLLLFWSPKQSYIVYFASLLSLVIHAWAGVFLLLN